MSRKVKESAHRAHGPAAAPDQPDRGDAAAAARTPDGAADTTRAPRGAPTSTAADATSTKRDGHGATAGTRRSSAEDASTTPDPDDTADATGTKRNDRTPATDRHAPADDATSTTTGPGGTARTRRTPTEDASTTPDPDDTADATSTKRDDHTPATDHHAPADGASTDTTRAPRGADAAPGVQPAPRASADASGGRGKRSARKAPGDSSTSRTKRTARKASGDSGTSRTKRTARKAAGMASDPHTETPSGRGKRKARGAAAGRLVATRGAGGDDGSSGGDGGQPVSLAAEAYRAIRDKLVMLELRPGTPINDERLARELGMGRTPVREALKRLETERLVVTFPRRGTFATDVNITDLAHIFEVREHLEPAAAASAAARATADDRALLEHLLEALDADHALDEAPEPLMALDMRVHRAIYAATHNPYFEDTLVLYDNLATRIWCLFLDRLSGLAGHVGDHSPLLLAVIDGDAEKAADLARDHVVRFERAIRAVI